MLHNTRGGSRDTAAKEFTVIATGPHSSSAVVSMLTPVANRPKQLRNARLSKITSPYECAADYHGKPMISASFWGNSLIVQTVYA